MLRIAAIACGRPNHEKVLYGVMLIALLASGCIIQSPFVMPEPEAAPQTTDTQPVCKHVTAVRADEVTTENAHQKAQEAFDEIENDREAPMK